MSRTKFSVKMNMGNNSKIREDKVTVLCTALLLNETSLPTSSLLIPLADKDLCPGQN